jgi:anti-sigma factor (TIGR02949 family)
MSRMSCDEAVRQFFAYLDQAMSGTPLQEFEQHLEECLDCCDKLQFSRRVDALVRTRVGDAPLPEGVEDRIRRRLAAAVTAPKE